MISKDEQMNIAIEHELKEKIIEAAKKEDLSVSNFVRRLIKKELENEDN